MVTLIPENENPTKQEIDAHIYKMFSSNSHDILIYTVREINNKSGAGALLHPCEKYFVNSFNNIVKNMSLEDPRLPDQRYNFDKACNDL